MYVYYTLYSSNLILYQQLCSTYIDFILSNFTIIIIIIFLLKQCTFTTVSYQRVNRIYFQNELSLMLSIHEYNLKIIYIYSMVILQCCSNIKV